MGVSERGRVFVGHPVDVATGALFHEFEDHVQPGRMMLIFGRRYGSRSAGRNGMFGPGWSSPFEMKIRRDLEGYRLTAEDGETEIIFDDSGGVVEQGGTVRNLGAFHELRYRAGQLVVTRWSSDSDEVMEYVFPVCKGDAPSLLASVQRPDGNGIDVRRDADGRISLLAQRRERRGYRLVYNKEDRVIEVYLIVRIHEVVESHPQIREVERRVLQYSYNAKGRLSECIDALGNSSRYEYDEAGRLSRETNIGGMTYGFQYDARGRCIETTGEDGYGRVRLGFDDANGITSVADSLDHVSRYHWNASGQVGQEISPLGRVSITSYDLYGRIVARISPSGRATTYEYDEQGDRTRVTGPTGAVWRYTYDQHRLSKAVDPAGHEWSQTFSRYGIVSATDPTGAAWTAAYSATGDCVDVTDPEGVRRSFKWDLNGDLVEATDWLGAATRYEYDSEGQIRAEVDPDGERSEYQYDLLGRPILFRHSRGSRHYQWNSYDQLTEHRDEEGNVTRRRFTAAGSLIEVLRPNGGRLHFDWSRVPGQLLGVVNERGERHKLEYDPDGLLIAETDFAGRITRYERDPEGDVLTLEDPLGRRTQFAYDGDGRVVRVTRHDGMTITGEYDPRGFLLRASNGDCEVTRQYDVVGNLLSETQGRYEVRSQYDRRGDRVFRQSSVGYSARFSWDGNGQLSRLAPVDYPGLTFRYDASGRELERATPGGLRILQAFDGRARCTDRTLAGLAGASGAGATQANVYDSGARLLEVRGDWPADRRYRYDSVGQIVALDVPGLLAERISYDLTGNIVARASELGSPTTPLATESRVPVELGFRYGRGGSLAARGEVAYQYDGAGQLTSKHEATGETKYGWDSDGKLKQVTLPDGSTWTYTYDPFGRRVSKRGPSATYNYVWDGDVVLHEILEEESGKPNVTTWEFDPSSFAPIAKISGGTQTLCVNDVSGRPEQMVDGDGVVVWRQAFDSLGQPFAAEGEAAACPVGYQGQWYDSESGLFYNRFRYYDAVAGRYISPDPEGLGGGLSAYAYPPNTTGWIDPYGLTGSCPTWNEFQKRNKGKFKNRKEAAVGWRAYKEANQSTNNLSIGRQPATARAKKAGRQILALPAGWTPAVNDAWVQGGIDRPATFRLESRPTQANRTHPVYGVSVFGREMNQLEAAGYRQRGNYMVPP
jgi:RHS repeat-associated protein